MSFIDALIGHLAQHGAGHGIGSDDLPLLVPAVVAAGAMVAFADGATDPAELREIDDEALGCLMGDATRTEDIHRVLAKHLSNYDRDVEFGHDRALAVLADFSDAPEDQRALVLRAALDVGGAGSDGALTQPERDAALEIARILKLDPAAHGL
jgi:tellurite resistance protein